MPSNIEFKAVLRDRKAALATAARLAESGPITIHQDDIFFRTDDGARLKLRIFDSARGELIRYERDNIAQARTSRYVIAPTTDPIALAEILEKTLGVVGRVRKTRILYLIGQTRVHIDDVDGLGDYFELEVVLRPDQAEEEGRRVATRLMNEFGIDSRDIVADAYVDLLRSRQDYDQGSTSWTHGGSVD